MIFGMKYPPPNTKAVRKVKNNDSNQEEESIT
jgi:hypothetical protein